MKYFLMLISFCINVYAGKAQDCKFFFNREDLPEPLKSYEVFEYALDAKKETLILTATFDIHNRIIKKVYHKEYYIWSDGFQDPGQGIVLLDSNNHVSKNLILRQGSSDDGIYTYWEYYTYQYDVSGRLLISETPQIENFDAAMILKDSLLNYLAKEHVFQITDGCKSYYKYSSSGRIEQIDNYSNGGDTIRNTFFYDEQLRCVRNEIRKNNIPIEEIIHSYTNGFRISSYFSYNNEKGILTKIDERAVYKVKFDNQKLIYQSYSLKGVVLNETVYIYNKAGDIIECLQYGEKKVLKRKMEYHYKK